MAYAAKTLNFLSAFDRGMIFTLRMICVGCFSLLLLLLAGNVFVRYFPVAAFYWFDEVVEWMFAWMVFFGAAALWARDEHFKLEWINKKIRGTPAGHLAAAGLELISLFFLVIFFSQALRLTIMAKDWTPVFNVSRRYLYVCMPISGFIMVGYSVRNVLRELLAFWQMNNGDRMQQPAKNQSGPSELTFKQDIDDGTTGFFVDKPER